MSCGWEGKKKNQSPPDFITLRNLFLLYELRSTEKVRVLCFSFFSLKIELVFIGNFYLHEIQTASKLLSRFYLQFMKFRLPFR